MHRALYFIPLFLIMSLSCNLVTGGRGREENLPTVSPVISSPTNQSDFNGKNETPQTPQPATEVPLTQLESCPFNKDKLLFASEINAQGTGPVNFEIFIANSDGSNINRLTNSDRWDGNPAWSPERCRVAFSETTDQLSNQDILVANLDGSGLIRLTDDASFDREPSWSPDGTQIVFMREHDGNRDIFIMNSDGSAIRQLTDHDAQDEDPEWSPNSDEIVFSSRRDGNWEIYLVNSDGTGLTRLTNDKSQDTHPTWSQDGQRIAFLSNWSAYNEIYIAEKDGANLRQVTFQNGEVPSVDIELNWSRSEGMLAFTCTIHGKDGGGMQAICAVDEDGGNVWTLINRDPSRSHEPDW